MKSLTV
jgi:hypothetical protein